MGELRKIAGEIMEYLNDGLVGENCDFCNGYNAAVERYRCPQNEDFKHEDGCLCDELRKALEADAPYAAAITRLETHIARLQDDFREADADDDACDTIGQSVVLEGQAMAIAALRSVVRDLRKDRTR